MKERKNISSKHTKNSKVCILILISGITDFKTKFIINDKEGHDSVIMESIKKNFMLQFSSVQFSRSVMSDSLGLHESQHARPPCPSPTPGVHSDSRPSSQ